MVRMEAFVDKCLRLCYDPHSKYLSEHYRLGERLGKGNFGEVRAARLRLKSHMYSKRVVGRQADWQQRRADQARRASQSILYGKSLLGKDEEPLLRSKTCPGLSELSESRHTEAEQRRANLDKRHYAQGLVDWPYACKVIKKSRCDVKGILREIDVLNKCQQPHVLLLVEHFETDKQICMLTGRCYGDVEKLHKAGPIALPVVKKWILQVLDALAFVHLVEFVHRDVKLPNLMLTSSRPGSDIVLGDFGFAESAGKLLEQTKDICGTPLMLSPETFDGSPQQFPSDVWACGCCLYELVAREHPFSNSVVQKFVKDCSPVEELAMSCVLRRQDPEKAEPCPVRLLDARPNSTGLRARADFHKVASRFSKNARFVERFQDLAVAVTSPVVKVDTSARRFSEQPELRDLVLRLLTRDVAHRPSAAELVADSPELSIELEGDVCASKAG